MLPRYTKLRMLIAILAHVITDQVLLPIIRVQPKSQTVMKDSSVELVCDSGSLSYSDIIWLRNNKILRRSSNVQFQDGVLSLQHFGAELTANRAAHPGNYSCIVLTPHGRLRSHMAELSLAYQDEFDSTKRGLRSLIMPLFVQIGSLAIIRCSVPKCKPLCIPFVYSHRGIIFRSSEKFRITPSGNLYLTNVQATDSGLYRCGALNPTSKQIVNDTLATEINVVNAAISEYVNTTIVEPPVASKVKSETNLTLECAVSDAVLPQTSRSSLQPLLRIIEWEKFEGVLPEGRSKQDHRTGILEILDLRKEDRGTYICKVRANHNRPNLIFRSLVEIEESPSIANNRSLLSVGEHQSVTTAYGADVQLDCKAQGRPVPTISWYFNSKPVNGTGPYIKTEYALGIVPVSHREEGIYQCIAENKHGSSSKTFWVAISRPVSVKANRKLSKIDRMPPPLIGDVIRSSSSSSSSSLVDPPQRVSIRSGPANASALIGDTVVLTCLVDGEGELFIEWLHNGHPVNPSSSKASNDKTNMTNTLDVAGATGSLRIYGAQLTDSGQYTCVASSTNSPSMVQSSGFVEIIEDKSHAQTPAKKSVGSQQANSRINQMKYHRRSGLSRNPESSSNELILVSLTDISDLGVEEGIALKWDIVRGSSDVDFFKVLYRRGSTGDKEYFCLDESLAADARSYVVDSLTPAKTYTFKIEAISKSGARYSSNPMEYRKEKPTPSSSSRRNTVVVNGDETEGLANLKPLNMPVIVDLWEIPQSSDQAGPMAIGLKWKMKVTDNNNIEGFYVHHRPVDTKFNYTKIRVPVSSKWTSSKSQQVRTFSHSIHNLSKSIRHEFRICAFNKHWTSGLSNAVLISKSGDKNENVIWVQDTSQLSSDVDNSLLNGLASNERFALSSMDGPIHRMKNLPGGSHPSGTAHSMLVYSSVGIALASMVVLLLTASLVCLARYYHRHRREGKQTPGRRRSKYGCIGSSCSIGSESSKRSVSRKINSENSVCYCDTSSGQLSMPKLFSLSRRHNNNNNNNNNNNPDMMAGSCGGVYVNRCPACRFQTIRAGCKFPLIPANTGNCAIVNGSNAVNSMQMSGGQSSFSSAGNNDISVVEACRKPIVDLLTPAVNNQRDNVSENFYHTLSDTPNCTLYCHCCGTPASPNEVMSFRNTARKKMNTACFCSANLAGSADATIEQQHFLHPSCCTASSSVMTSAAGNPHMECGQQCRQNSHRCLGQYVPSNIMSSHHPYHSGATMRSMNHHHHHQQQQQTISRSSGLGSSLDATETGACCLVRQSILINGSSAETDTTPSTSFIPADSRPTPPLSPEGSPGQQEKKHDADDETCDGDHGDDVERPLLDQSNDQTST